MRIKSCVALVTGANRGIGHHFAQGLVERGASRVYAAARNPRLVTASGVEPIALDVTDPQSVAAAAARAGDVTLLINNAGVALTQDLVRGDLAQIRQEIETNVFGTLAMIRAFAPVLSGNGGGQIVNILSAASWFTYPGSGSYAVSTAAQWSLTNGVRLELDAQGTVVTGVHVGMVDTDMTAALDVEKIDPADLVQIALDGIEDDLVEIVADDLSARAKAALAGAPSLMIP